MTHTDLLLRFALGFAYVPRAQRTPVQVTAAVMVLVLLTVIAVTRTNLLQA